MSANGARNAIQNPPPRALKIKQILQNIHRYESRTIWKIALLFLFVLSQHAMLLVAQMIFPSTESFLQPLLDFVGNRLPTSLGWAVPRSGVSASILFWVFCSIVAFCMIAYDTHSAVIHRAPYAVLAENSGLGRVRRGFRNKSQNRMLNEEAEIESARFIYFASSDIPIGSFSGVQSIRARARAGKHYGLVLLDRSGRSALLHAAFDEDGVPTILLEDRVDRLRNIDRLCRYNLRPGTTIEDIKTWSNRVYRDVPGGIRSCAEYCIRFYLHFRKKSACGLTDVASGVVLDSWLYLTMLFLTWPLFHCGYFIISRLVSWRIVVSLIVAVSVFLAVRLSHLGLRLLGFISPSLYLPKVIQDSVLPSVALVCKSIGAVLSFWFCINSLLFLTGNAALTYYLVSLLLWGAVDFGRLFLYWSKEAVSRHSHSSDEADNVAWSVLKIIEFIVMWRGTGLVYVYSVFVAIQILYRFGIFVVVFLIARANQELNEMPFYARHPIRWLLKSVFCCLDSKIQRAWASHICVLLVFVAVETGFVALYWAISGFSYTGVGVVAATVSSAMLGII